MRLGFSTLFWSGALGPELDPWLERLAAWGYDGVELPVVAADDAALDRVRAACERAGLARCAVGFATAEADPASPDPAVRRAAAEHLARLVDRAQRLGATLLGGPLHSAYATFPPRVPDPETVAGERARAAEVLCAAAERAAAAGLALGLEFLNRFECRLATTAAEIHALVELAGHPALRTVYDTHHAHIEEASPAAALAACAPSLGHVQLSESHRGPLGTGQVRWDETFAALRAARYDGWLVVEAFSRTDPELGATLRIWRDTAPGAEAVARPAVDFVRRAWAAAR
jgi:D-psicose/D-tagatose/L-ribulose 3-epimerase